MTKIDNLYKKLFTYITNYTHVNMAKRVINIDGITLLADKEDIYSIVSGTDGYEYIVEQDETGNKFWNIYKEYCDDDLSVYKKNQIVVETIFENKFILKKIPSIDNIASKIEDEIIVNSEIDDKKDNPKIIKKIIIKKQIEPTAETIENNESSLKKIVIKPKKIDDNISDVKEPEKKLSKYHTFIKEFLGLNSHIPWNERMKAANEAWKNEAAKLK